MPQVIVQAGAPVLRQRARFLSTDEIRSRETQDLIEEMREAMRTAPGVGLAAPQIGHSLQIAVIEDPAEYHKDVPPEQLAERDRKPVPFHVLINPTIVSCSDDHKVFFEGCLSVAGFCALVPRSRTVRVDFLDQHGATRSMDAEGWHARIVQHEVDHLQGTLYIDRMLSRSFATVENVTQHWKGVAIQNVLDRLK
jgi:peptide deformylase